MSLSARFIRGPVLTTVCSLVILIMGGIANITVAFPVAIDRNIAQVNVQNRVNQATPGLRYEIP
jgi:multidrug efflux pump subunit AcrB